MKPETKIRLDKYYTASFAVYLAMMGQEPYSPDWHSNRAKAIRYGNAMMEILRADPSNESREALRRLEAEMKGIEADAVDCGYLPRALAEQMKGMEFP